MGRLLSCMLQSYISPRPSAQLAPELEALVVCSSTQAGASWACREGIIKALKQVCRQTCLSKDALVHWPVHASGFHGLCVSVPVVGVSLAWQHQTPGMLRLAYG